MLPETLAYAAGREASTALLHRRDDAAEEKECRVAQPSLSYRLLSWCLAQECLQAQKSHVQHMSSLLESSRSSGAVPTGDCVKMPSS